MKAGQTHTKSTKILTAQKFGSQKGITEWEISIPDERAKFLSDKDI